MKYRVGAPSLSNSKQSAIQSRSILSFIKITSSVHWRVRGKWLRFKKSSVTSLTVAREVSRRAGRGVRTEAKGGILSYQRAPQEVCGERRHLLKHGEVKKEIVKNCNK